MKFNTRKEVNVMNVEKYIEALDNILGVDHAYFSGDEHVETLVELIVVAKKLENRVKELEAEKDALIKNYAGCMKDYAKEIFDEIRHVGLCPDGIILNWWDIADLKKKYIEGKQ